jgi:hypothetical protein
LPGWQLSRPAHSRAERLASDLLTAEDLTQEKISRGKLSIPGPVAALALMIARGFSLFLLNNLQI